MAAILALDSQKTMGEHPAFDEIVELIADILGKAPSGRITIRGHEEGLEVFSHRFVEHGIFRPTGTVGRLKFSR
jgi:hypothetical protein